MSNGRAGDDHERLSELISRLCDNLITDEQFWELDSILEQSAEARRFYHVYIANHHALENDALTQRRSEKPEASISRALTGKSAAQSTAALIASILAVAGFIRVTGLQSNNADIPDQIAVVTYSSETEQTTNVHRLTAGDSVGPGHLKLDSGLVRLEYRQGVVLSLVGPADFEIVSAEHALLHRGQIAAYVPPGAEGFRIDTPSAGIVDLGTEFGMTVDQRGETQLSVFDGQVKLSSAAGSDAMIVSAGHGYQVDSSGRTKRLFELAPYRDARDSLRGWQIVWEPFGPGSETGRFPGQKGAGWKGPWEVRVDNGMLLNPTTGVFDEQPLHPGAEFYFTVHAQPKNESDQVRAVVSRRFEPIDQFTLSRPVTIELLVRLESNPNELEEFRIFSTSQSDSPVWSLNIARDQNSKLLKWKTSETDNGPDSPPVQWWESHRCFIEIDPDQSTWRVTVASRNATFSNNLQAGIPLKAPIGGSMSLKFEATGRAGKPVKFSLDGIRIQNHPDYSPIAGDAPVRHEE